MAPCKVVATVTGASNDAEVLINASDVPMTASGGDQWDGSANLDLPAQAPLRVTVVGVAQTWGIEISFTPPRAAFPNPYKKQNLTLVQSPLLDVV
jgi:hypothetical protein